MGEGIEHAASFRQENVLAAGGRPLRRVVAAERFRQAGSSVRWPPTTSRVPKLLPGWPAPEERSAQMLVETTGDHFDVVRGFVRDGHGPTPAHADLPACSLSSSGRPGW